MASTNKDKRLVSCRVEDCSAALQWTSVHGPVDNYGVWLCPVHDTDHAGAQWPDGQLPPPRDPGKDEWRLPKRPGRRLWRWFT